MRISVLMLSFFLIFLSCSDDDDATTTPANAVQLSQDSELGSILTDSEGNTLYFFSLDHTGTTSLCTGDCLDAWPIFYAENLTLDSGLTASDFGEITHPNGEKQSTYKGWPLYYFANDTNPGDTNGENVANVWFVAKPDYTVMYAEAQLIGRNSAGEVMNLVIDNNGDYVEGDGLTFYITDDRGRTLYTFMNDRFETNNFTIDNNPNSDRNQAWPVAQITGTTVPTVLNSDDFGTIQIQGWTQLTYKGWPLYYYGPDNQTRGNNFGTGSPMPGIWPIANTDTGTATAP